MNAMSSEQVMWELLNEELMISGEQGGHLPPGFRFHPTDEELISYYLASKVFTGGFCGVDIVEVDLNRCEPWELPDVAKMGEREWYFFSLRDRKYPTGLRTNRATGAGYWKATGKDREVHSAATGALVGMKKTLVFYKGRAPRGEKTKWVLHEYRLEGDYSCRHSCKEEWVICRIFNKSSSSLSATAVAADKIIKNQYCFDSPTQKDHRTFNPPPPLQELQTLDMSLSPIQSLLQNNNPFLNPSPNSNPLFWEPPQNLQLQDQEALSNWFDVYLQQNPGIYELAFGSQLLPSVQESHLCSLLGPTSATAVAEFGPLVP